MQIGFFTAVSFDYCKSSFLEKTLGLIDHYFYFGEKKAFVVKGKTKENEREVVLYDSECSLKEKKLKIRSYYTLVLPVCLFALKYILRSRYKFRVINIEKELKEGVRVHIYTFLKIQMLLPQILSKSHSEYFKWISYENNFVFQLPEEKNYLFKISPLALGIYKDRNEKRYANMIKAKTICKIHDLHLLIIPHAIKVNLTYYNQNYVVIAEEVLDFSHGDFYQRLEYENYSDKLNNAIRQISVFIAKSGFHDVYLRNIPVLNEASNYMGDRRIGLIDLEDMYDNLKGEVGQFFNQRKVITGFQKLINSVRHEEHIDIIADEANKHGIELNKNMIQYAKQSCIKKSE